ncbi:MAG: MarR family transcriptional regulator [Chryseolinea sp.]
MSQLEEFRTASRRYSDMSMLMHEAIARRAGLSGTDHKYLGLMMEKGPMTAGALAQLTGLTGGAITGLIDRLEEKKLARREYDNEDRRKVYIIADSAAVLKLMTPIFKDLQQKTMKLLMTYSDNEITLIRRYMEEAVVVMNDALKNLKD